MKNLKLMILLHQTTTDESWNLSLERVETREVKIRKWVVLMKKKHERLNNIYIVNPHLAYSKVTMSQISSSTILKFQANAKITFEFLKHHWKNKSKERTDKLFLWWLTIWKKIETNCFSEGKHDRCVTVIA